MVEARGAEMERTPVDWRVVREGGASLLLIRGLGGNGKEERGQKTWTNPGRDEQE